MKSIIQKGIIPARTQSQDKKFQTSRPCEVRRSGQVTTFVVCAVLSLSFQAVVLFKLYLGTLVTSTKSENKISNDCRFWESQQAHCIDLFE